MFTCQTYGEINSFRELYNCAPESLQRLLCSMKSIPQKKLYHPEGNVLKHIIIVVNRAIETGDINLLCAALFHDLGKKDAFRKTFWGAPIAHGHERFSALIVFKYRAWIKECGACPITVFNIVRRHMIIKRMHEMRRKKAEKLKNNPYFGIIQRFATIDKGGYKS